MQQPAFYKNASRRRLHALFSIQRLRMMKLTVLLLTVVCLHVTAGSSAQGVSLKLVNADLKKVFAELKRQTTFQFIYNNEQLKQARKVTITVTNADFNDVLAMVFRDQPLNYAIEEGRYVVIKPKPVASAEPTDTTIAQVRGRVVTDKGEPVPGATISVKGTNKATATDNNGIFILRQVNSEAVVVISGANIETRERKLNGSNDLNIIAQLKSVEGEEIVINTGYQKLRPNTVTGSIAVVSNERLNQQVGANILERLDGVASGVMFPKHEMQDGPQFMIRGFSTINGPKTPLIIVDNFPYDGDINNINPNDVESISVLKDAAAASIWGARAANGVVVISTKRGKRNQPISISLNTNYRVGQKPDIMSLRTISSADYIDIESMLFEKGFYNSSLSNTRTFPALSPVVEILSLQRNGVITEGEAKAQMDAFRNVDSRKEYSEHIYQKGIAQQHALNLSGGSENLTYYLSVGYDRTESNLKEVENRLTVRSENQFYPFKSLMVSLGAQFTSSKGLSGQSTYGAFRTGTYNLPYAKFVDEAGNALGVTRSYRQPYIDTAGNGLLLDWNYYPLEEYKHTRTTTNLNDLLANVGINYKPFSWLSMDIKYMYDRQGVASKRLSDVMSYEARDLINLYTTIDRSTGALTHAIPFGAILNHSISTLQTHNVRGQLNIDKSFASHKVSAILGAETRQAAIDGYSGRSYGYDANTLESQKVDLINYYPTFITGRSTLIPGGEQFINTLSRYVSFYGNAAYAYKSKYMITVSGRRDASNLFGVNTNNKWNPLWSAGVGWILSSEPFYQVNWLSHLKLKATYGYTGNTDPTKGAVLTTMSLGASNESNLPYASVGLIPNPELRWEKLRTINLGVDFSGFKNTLAGSLEIYQKKGTDLFGASPVDPTTGLNNLTTMTRNIASMKANGLDLTLTATLLDGIFKWNSTLLFSYNVSKVSQYYRIPGVLSGSYLNNGNSISPLNGKHLYSIAVLKYAGLDDKGSPQGFLEKQVSTDYANIVYQTPLEDLIYKPSIPKVFGSFINSLTWRVFSLSANISYRFGYYFVKPSIFYSAVFSNGANVGSADFSNRWQQPGDELYTNVPSLVYPLSSQRDQMFNNSDALVFNASNVKLQYVNFSYSVNSKQQKNKVVQLVELYINVSNLGILWKANKEGLDPDYVSKPVLRKVVTIGLKASF